MNAPVRRWLIWTASFVSFPLAGVAAMAAVGRVDGAGAALGAGLITGAIIGAGQSLASSRRLDPRRWIIASAPGMGLGLLLGAAAVDYRTGLGDLVVMGAVSGAVLGVAQALALHRVALIARLTWAAAIPALWALGWTLTTLGGIDVDRQWSVFGSFGAIAAAALSGLLAERLLPVAAPDRRGVSLQSR